MKKSEIACLIIAGLLLFIWPIPHTISVRDLLLVVSCALFGYFAYRHRPFLPRLRELRAPLGFYLALTLWIAIVALFISGETGWSLAEFRGQWLKGAMALAAGCLLAVSLRHNRRAHTAAVMLVYGVLMVHVIYIDIIAIQVFVEEGFIPRSVAGFTEASDKSNYLTNMLLYILFAEAFIRVAYRERFLPLGYPVLGLSLVLALFSARVESMRNGVIELAVVMSVLAILFVLRNKLQIARITRVMFIACLVLVPAVFAYLSYKVDDRWQSFFDTLPIAWDTDRYRHWTNVDKISELTLSSGKPVDWSNYMRVARMKVGIELVLEKPLGVGFGRNAFAHAVKSKFGEDTSHSHSGLVDLAVGVGVPGILLWLGMLVSLGYVGWRQLGRRENYLSLLLVMLTIGFSVRMLLDSIIRDHMLQMFLFLAGLVAVMGTRELQPAKGPATRTA